MKYYPLNKRGKIKAFTLIEFSISMTISTTIVGLLLLSFYFMGRWNQDYYKGLFRNEEIYIFLATLKLDIVKANSIDFESSELLLYGKDVNVVYKVDKVWATRSSESITDTFNISNLSLNPIFVDKDKLLQESIVISVASANYDTIRYTIPLLNSTTKKLAITNAY